MAHQSLDVNLFFKAKQKKSISIKKKLFMQKRAAVQFSQFLILNALHLQSVKKCSFYHSLEHRCYP